MRDMKYMCREPQVTTRIPWTRQDCDIQEPYSSAYLVCLAASALKSPRPMCSLNETSTILRDHNRLQQSLSQLFIFPAVDIHRLGGRHTKRIPLLENLNIHFLFWRRTWLQVFALHQLENHPSYFTVRCITISLHQQSFMVFAYLLLNHLGNCTSVLGKIETDNHALRFPHAG